MVKKVSIERVLSAYHNVDLGKIAQIQSFVSVRDAKSIKTILNKPNIQDSTALAYGRLANQYIKIITKPSNQAIKIVKTKYQVNLDNSYYDNLLRMKNNIVFYKPISIQDILKVNMVKKLTIRPYEFRTIITIISDNDIADFLRNIQLSGNAIAQLKKHKIYNYQILLDLKLSSGNTQIVSTKQLIIPAYSIIQNFILKYTNVALSKNQLKATCAIFGYWYDEKRTEGVEFDSDYQDEYIIGINKIIIRWKR